MTLSRRDIAHIIERLRSGTVPTRGIEAFAVGVEGPRAELRRMLRLTSDGEGAFKLLRGGYGCGKTFMARLAMQDALAEGFATSFVVVSDNDLHFHRFDELYRKVVQGLATPTCPEGALGDILDRWIGRTEEALIDGGADESAEDFDARVAARLVGDLQARTRGELPEEMARALEAIFQLKQQRQTGEAASLVAWLSGSTNISAKAKALAGVKGDIESDQAMRYLRGVVEIIKASGYKGLVIVVDELETIARQRSDTRGKSLNGLRQIIDGAASMPGLLWLMTGTPNFFDDPRSGVASLPPLHDRVKLERIGGRTSLRGAQLELTPFDEGRLRDVALKLRELYPAADPDHLRSRVSHKLVDDLIDSFTQGFGGQIKAVPRVFLRRYITILDLVDEQPDFDPASALGFDADDLNEHERALLQGGVDDDGLFADG